MSGAASAALSGSTVTPSPTPTRCRTVAHVVASCTMTGRRPPAATGAVFPLGGQDAGLRREEHERVVEQLRPPHRRPLRETGGRAGTAATNGSLREPGEAHAVDRVRVPHDREVEFAPLDRGHEA